jgi:glutathione S-transferase
MIKLHVFPSSPRSFKVLALAEHLGLEYRRRFVDLTKGDQDTPEFTALNPNQRVPVLEDDDFVLWESNAILQYLAEQKPGSGLLPTDPRRRADVSRWQFWDMAHWDPVCAIMIYEHLVKKIFGGGEPDAAEVAKGQERFHRVAKVLDGHLQRNRYLVGQTLTVADFSVGAPLNVATEARLPLADYAHIKRWHAELSEMPAWKKSLATPNSSS